MPRNGERGELSLWLIVVMAVAVGLVWAIPMVFLQHEETSHDAELIAPAPTGNHHRGSSEAPADPIGKSNDVQAQADLMNAVSVAQMYFAEHAGFDGFTPQAASSMEPSIRFTNGAATPGTVSIRGAGGASVVMVTATARGPLCAAVSSGTVSQGRADAQAPAQCTGGW